MLAAVVGGQSVAQPVVAAPSAPASRYASIVLEAETGAVLYERNADLPRAPASLTKIMTLYLAFEALATKRLALTDELTMSAYAVARDPSRLNLAPGSKLKVEDAIRAMTTKSANDAACAIAEHLGKGSEARFGEIMTAKAKTLGLTKTTFHNASGLPHEGHVSSARDLALLSKALVKDYPGYYHYFSDGSFEFHGKRYPNQNRFLRTYYGADGIKTGFVNCSGHNLAASAIRGGKRLIAIVLGGDTQGWTREHASRLLDTSYAKLDPSLVMVASNAGGTPGAPAGPAEANTPAPVGASVSVSVSVSASAPSAAPAGAYATPAGAVTIRPSPSGAVTVPAADPIPMPNGTANLLAYAAAASAPKGIPARVAKAPAAVAQGSTPEPPAAPAPVQPAPAAPVTSAPAPPATAKATPAPAAQPSAGARAEAPSPSPAQASTVKPVEPSPPSPKPRATEPSEAARADQANPPAAPAAITEEFVEGEVLARTTATVPTLAKKPVAVPAPAPQAKLALPSAPVAAASAPGSVPATAPSPDQASNPAAEAANDTEPAEVVTTNTGGGEWSVQVGLFRDATVARRRGEEARNRMPLQLRGADLVVGRAVDGVHVTSRISRLSEQDARAACSELQRGQVPCVVVPPGRPMVVATN